MNPADFIGFIITFFAISFLAYRRIKEERLKREHPDLYQEKERKKQEELEEFLRSMDIGEKPAPQVKRPEPVIQERVVKEPKPHRKSSQGFDFQSDLESYRQQTKLEERQLKANIEERYKVDVFHSKFVTADLSKSQTYEVTGKAHPSRIANLLERMPSKKEMVLFQEVIGPPKALRK